MNNEQQTKEREAARIEFHERRELESNEHDFAFLDGFDAGVRSATAPVPAETDEPLIALPVRYDDQLRWVVDSDGSFVADLNDLYTRWPGISNGDYEPLRQQLGQHIANAINAYRADTSKALERLEEAQSQVKALREACKKALTCASINSDVRNFIESALATSGSTSTR